jgi:hypothetical protein
VTFTDNHNGTATLTGTPTRAGAFPITVRASNGATTDATQSFTLSVVTPPAITSGGSTTFTAGLPGTFTVTTSPGYPTATALTVTGTLPSGVTFTDNGNGTATLAGTASVTATSSFPLTFKASNGIGPDPTKAFTLTVNKVATVDLPAKQPALNGSLTGVPAKSTVGQTITVSGSGYTPGAPITLGWYSARTVLAHSTAGTNGAFTVTLMVPNQTGSKMLVAAGLGANGKARYLGSATVVNPSKSTSTSTGVAAAAVGTRGNAALPLTGTTWDLRALAAAGIAFTLTGFGLLGRPRRRL